MNLNSMCFVFALASAAVLGLPSSARTDPPLSLVSARVAIEGTSNIRADSITFRDTRHRSFRHYEGRWRITPHGGSTELTYELVAEPSCSVPNRLATRLLTRDASRMIERLRVEMVRRDAPESRHPPEPSCSSEERTR